MRCDHARFLVRGRPGSLFNYRGGACTEHYFRAKDVSATSYSSVFVFRFGTSRLPIERR